MKSLVVGYGSIGQRHAQVLKDLGDDVAIVSRSASTAQFKNVEDAFKKFAPDYIVIANETSRHHQTLQEVSALGYRAAVLVEKPLFERPFAQADFKHLSVYVGYNMRLHPVIQKLRELLQNETLLAAQIYVGSYLPGWRPAADYRQTSSAQKKLGGGVLRELSHELDYANWLLGSWQSLSACSGHFSNLEIDTDDVGAVLWKAARCPVVTLQMNYVDRLGQRQICIQTNDKTFKADLIANTLQINEKILRFEVERNDTYRAEHQAIRKKDFASLCTLQEAEEVLKMIEAVEKSSKEKIWISRN